MAVAEQAVGDRLVLSPQEALIAGGAAEEFERRVQALFRQGYRHIVTDLRKVPYLDSAGIRALVRGYTTSQRLGGSFKLAGPNARVRGILEVAHLENVFGVFESVEQARAREVPWQTIRIGIAGAVLCGALVWSGLRWPVELVGVDVGVSTEFPAQAGSLPSVPRHVFQPFLELIKLVVAALIGLLVTAIHRPSYRDRPLSRSMEQAQTLLCVSGAMMMIIIGNSLARAFGIAGAASIIRFRTPVEDPKDVTILFLLMGLGMSSGLGAFAVAGLGTAFLCIFLLILDKVREQKPRAMMVEVLAEGREFPTDHVQGIFARNKIVFEPREISQGDEVIVKYHAYLDPGTSLEDLSAQLMAEGKAGVKSVAWEHAKKGGL